MQVNSQRISAEDCKKVLTKYFNNNNCFKLVNFHVAPISENINGFLGDHLLLKLKLENVRNELRFFAKMLPTGHKDIAEFIISSNMFNKEAACYKFLEDVERECSTIDTSFAPKIYFWRSNEVIILEDVSETGYNMWDGPLELDLIHLQLCLETAAKLHAASIVYEETKSKNLERIYQITDDYGEGLQEALYIKDPESLSFKYLHSGIKGLCAIKNLLPKTSVSSSEFKQKIHALIERVYEDIKPSTKFRNVWCHGDLWTNNVMFRYSNGKPTSCKLIDFQLQRYNPPAHDILFMIYQTTNREIRRLHFQQLVDFYYSSLKLELEKSGLKIESNIDRDEFERSIEFAYPTVKLTKAIYKSLSGVGQVYIKQLMEDSERYSYVTFNDRSEFVAEIIEHNQTFRNMMMELIEDLEDVFLHDRII